MTSESKLDKRRKSQLGKHNTTGNDKKERSGSISRAREKHRRNLKEINQINDSVKYSVKHSARHSAMNEAVKLNHSMSSIEGMTADENEYSASKKPKVEHSLSMTQSMALKHIPLEQINTSNVGSKQLSRVNSTDRDVSSNKIDKLQQNLAKLEKLERRLMRGRGKSKKSSRMPEGSEMKGEMEATTTTHGKQAAKSKDEKKSKKKRAKNWRFAYDLYCKELISGNQPQ